MELLFLGTGAADHDWSRYGEQGVLGSAAALLEKHILIDCGPTVAKAVERFGISPEQITAVVNTHNHSDHLNFDVLQALSGNRKIDFYGSVQACEKAASFCTVHPLTMGDEFEIGSCRFLTLPSNHAVADLKEETFNYLISHEEKTLLYALDTSWMTIRARRLIGNRHIDTIIWDATMSEPDDWRIFEHSDPVMFNSIRRVLEKTGNIAPDVQVYFSHRARTLWPEDPVQQEAIARKANALLAIEGEKIQI